MGLFRKRSMVLKSRIPLHSQRARSNHQVARGDSKDEFLRGPAPVIAHKAAYYTEGGLDPRTSR
eukprot:scaffold62_cov256-Pinguiococcus_pyrenoidosus.AAC.6